MAGLLFIYYLRFVSIGNVNIFLGQENPWSEVEELIKNKELIDYWRSAIAMELIKNEIL